MGGVYLFFKGKVITVEANIGYKELPTWTVLRVGFIDNKERHTLEKVFFSETRKECPYLPVSP